MLDSDWLELMLVLLLLQANSKQGQTSCVVVVFQLGGGTETIRLQISYLWLEEATIGCPTLFFGLVS